MHRLVDRIWGDDIMRALTGARGSLPVWAGLALLLAATSPPRAAAQTPAGPEVVPGVAASLDLSLIAHPLEHPWSIAFLPDGDILVTERPGRLRLVREGALLPEPVRGVPEMLTGLQAGLLDVLPDTGFADSRLLYLSYVVGTPEAASVRIMRARLAGEELVDQEVIFESRPPAPGLEQFGGRLAFGPDGLLYLTLGDRFAGERAQDLGDHAGSTVRLGRDGGVPPDNPFLGVPGALPELFTVGHRNPQGLALDPAGRRLWSHEHGPQGGDELNVLEGGRNYGWPRVTYGVDYDGTPIGTGTHAPGTEPPVRHWTPSVATSGMAFVAGDRFAGWQGSLLIGTLREQALLRLELEGGRVTREERLVEGLIGRIRDVRSAPDGYVYLVTDDPEGGLYRLAPTVEQAVRLLGDDPHRPASETAVDQPG
jgi:glucose/arabinose dehydrogenase